MNGLSRIVNHARKIHTTNGLLRETPKNIKGKKHSSQLWLSRQIRDPYVEKARQEHYRCRSAFKLIELNERHKFFTPGQIVVDCGAAPGSWTQVAIKMTNADGKQDKPIGSVYAIDRLPIYPIEGATTLGNTDFTAPESQEKLAKMLNDKKVDVVLSDMAPNATGMRDLDHENIIKLAYTAFKFALQFSKTDGIFIVKVWDGGKTSRLEQDLLKFYKLVKPSRPDATRDESAEMFFLARGFKGLRAQANS